ncbi:FtsX-like permease family protein [Bacillus sp. BH32]|uniref:FtsX-like permease family protein n=1 Tax=Bacillus sp. BH32 TaxID=2528961 RepID=UPI0010630F0A|nr:FtsX-like permease family protein [Bacillus sp. BH32]NYS75206.1 FtsX-like permease family protein [Bacillus sp. BH32]
MKFWQFALKNVLRNSRAYFAYFLSSSFSIAVFFSFSVYVFHPQLQKIQELQEHEALLNMSQGAQVTIVLFSFLFLFYSVSTFLKVRKKQFVVLTILGISNKQLRRLVFIENMFIGVLSIFMGTQAGSVFFYLFLLITSKLTGAQNLYLYLPIKAVILTIIIFSILFLIVSMLTPILIRTRKTKRLIEEKHLNKQERKPSFLLPFLGLVCLGVGYYIAGDTDWYMKKNGFANMYRDYIIISIIPLVSIGTYLLFSQVIFVCISLLKKNRKFYMKQINMLWISDLANRTRENINMLFIVTMLSALTFTIITALFAINNDTKSDIMKYYPIPFTYISYENNTLEQKHITTIEKELRNHQFKYKKYKSIVLKDRAFEREIMIMKESDYNSLSKLLDRQEIQLDDNEVVVASPFTSNTMANPFVKQNFIIFDSNKKIFPIKSFLPKVIEPYQEVMIIRDIVFDKMIPHLKTATIYNYFVDNWESSLIPTKSMLKVINQDSERFVQFKEENQNTPFNIYTASDALHVSKQDNISGFFIGTFLGVIFFIGAASVLYFQMYTDLTREEMKYITITKIGLTESEMFRSATIQLAALFFIPYIVATIHTIFAIKFLQSQFDVILLKELGFVLCLFWIIELVFFLLLRSFYINKLSQHFNL